MKRLPLYLAALASLFISPTASGADQRPACQDKVTLAGPDWRADVCLDGGKASIETALRAHMADIDETSLDDLTICVEADGSSACEVGSRHPWCEPDPQTGEGCDGDTACCILTIINGSCGGCLDPDSGE